MTTLFVYVCLFLVPALLLAKMAVWFRLALVFLAVLLLARLNQLTKVRSTLVSLL